MPFALYPSFFFTVVLFVTSAYFLLGGLPLLVLRHDEALDARFIRGFFNLYYRATSWAALGALLSYALWGRWLLAAGAMALAAFAVLLRLKLVPALEKLGCDIEANTAGAIARYRKLHGTALLLNLGQLVLVVWGIVQLSRSV